MLRLRRKLGSSGELIETVWGVGYRFRSAASDRQAPGADVVARVSGLRAAIEAGLVAAVLVIALLAIVPAQNTSPVWQAFGLGFFDIGCVAGVVAALRMRRSTDMSRTRAVAREAGCSHLRCSRSSSR